MNESTKLAPVEPINVALEKPEGAVPHSYNYGVDPNAENEIHLLDYWRAVRKRLWLVIGLAVLVTMLSVIYMAGKPDIYQASAQVQVDLENNAAVIGKTPYFVGTPNDPVYFNTQLQILTSHGLLRRVVKSLDLEHNPDFFKGRRETFSRQTVKRMAGFKGAEKTNRSAPGRVDAVFFVYDHNSADDLKEAKRLAPLSA